MDQIARLMNRHVPFEKILVPTGQVDGAMIVEPCDDNQYENFIRTHSSDQSSNYAEEFRKKEEEMYVEALRTKDESLQQEGAMSMVETADDLLSSIGRLEVDALKQEQSREVFTKYSFDTHKNSQLVIDAYRERILNVVRISDVVIIQGPTGCGKTTQVPQFILDDCKKNDKFCKIIVTQPRRIAAISVARRVCEERSWSLGTVCGYQVGLDRNIEISTLLSYVTTGVLLQKLISQKNLHEYSHIIIDEVHERIQEMDFLLLILRKFLNTNSMGTKIILMSATFNTEEFAHYFRSYNSNSIFLPAPIIYIDKAIDSFNTQTFYVDQLQLLGEAVPNLIAEPKIDKSLYRIFSKLVRTFDKLDVKDPITNINKIESVLVFLPGIVEIEEAHDDLVYFNTKVQQTKALEINNTKFVPDWEIIPLHSSITIDQQRKVFISPSPNHRRIILSTNIAESSITVPDVGYVVDFCLTKTMVVDSDTQYQSLQLQWASHINCTQRAGRVGRVSDGRVYRMVTRSFYEYDMPKIVPPEILRAPLGQVVLKSKMLDLQQPPKAILALALNPPNLNNIDTTVLFLKEIGALAMTCGRDKMIYDGDITFLGWVMARLPLDVHLSKLIFLGFQFSCLEECIIMATGCSLNIFKSPFKERLKAYTNRLQWADGSASDVIAYLNLYRVWQRKKRMTRDVRIQKEWCKQNFISLKTMREWEQLVIEVTLRLKQMDIQVLGGPEHVILSHTELPTVVKIVICGAFYPNYFKRSSDGGQVDEREAVKTLNGHDPCSTVYFTGFDPHQPGPLYSKSIKDSLQECGMHMQVFFDYSSKVYVEFSNSNQRESVNVYGKEFLTSMPGRIRPEVYRAIRMRQLRIPFNIPLLQLKAAWELADSLGITRPSPGMGMLPIMAKAKADAKAKVEEEGYDETDVVAHAPVLPSMDVQFICIRISEAIDAGHFWAHNFDTHTSSTLAKITRVLNSTTESLEKVDPKSIKCGSLCTARYKGDGLFYRCKVVALTLIDQKLVQGAQIIFIDYGNTDTVSLNELFMLPKDEYMSIPAQAMECFLSEVQPSEVLNHKCLWSENANCKLTLEQKCYGKVYSVVQDIVHLVLYFDEGGGCSFKNSFNEWLVKKGYAQPAEESFLSKENHEQRQQIIINPAKMSAFMKEEKSNMRDLEEFEPPSLRDCMMFHRLKGPFSPLEMQIYSVIATGQNKQIVVEGNSVNAVLLDTHAQDPHERLMVAGYIGQNLNASALSLRHTTLMPNIHGLPMLVSLLFCPTMEAKPTADGSRFGAILCGLGSHDGSHQALYPPHDICLTLDTDLTMDDLNEINSLRYWMNKALATMEANYNKVDFSTTIDNCQKELKTRLFRLLKRERKSVERVFIKHAGVWGKYLYNSGLLIPGEDDTSPLQIWPLHTTIQLETNVLDPSLESHIIELQEVAMRMRNMNEIHCRFCDQMLYSTGEVRVHMNTIQHREAVSAIIQTKRK